MSTNAKDFGARYVTAFHRLMYKTSGGRFANRIANMPVLLLTTTGRKTGQERTTPLTYMEDGDRVVLVASYGGDDRHPKWYLNLTANPQVKVTRGTETTAMRARTATAEERS